MVVPRQLISRFQFLIKKLRNIASTFHRSNQLNEALAKAQKEIAHLEKQKIIQEVAHRWNSMYLMALIIVRNHEVTILQISDQISMFVLLESIYFLIERLLILFLMINSIKREIKNLKT
jgi:hypothetical protein